jgi:site-specific recombinase XerD
MPEILSPIFRSRKATNGGRLHRISVTHFVKEAAKRAGISEKTSAHWLDIATRAMR